MGDMTGNNVFGIYLVNISAWMVVSRCRIFVDFAFPLVPYISTGPSVFFCSSHFDCPVPVFPLTLVLVTVPQCLFSFVLLSLLVSSAGVEQTLPGKAPTIE